MTIFDTVQLGWLDSDIRPQDALGRYLKQIGDYLDNYGVTRTSVWVLEGPPSEFSNGPVTTHAHILLHVPEPLIPKFREWWRHQRWLKAIGAQPASWKGIDIVRVIGAGRYAKFSYVENIANLVRYILKGVDTSAAREIGINSEPKNQTFVRGQRVGISENLNRKARERFLATAPGQSYRFLSGKAFRLHDPYTRLAQELRSRSTFPQALAATSGSPPPPSKEGRLSTGIAD
jgi:hypothetical protein